MQLWRSGQAAMVQQARHLSATPVCMGRCVILLTSQSDDMSGHIISRRQRRPWWPPEPPLAAGPSSPQASPFAPCRRSAKIAVRKGKADAQKSKLYGKIGKQIAQAVRQGGPDALANTRLRDALAAAKMAQVGWGIRGCRWAELQTALLKLPGRQVSSAVQGQARSLRPA